MKFNTDYYMEMGNSHNICEDYAINGTINGEVPYIIVCDGCSSSDHSDVGARIIAHCCQKVLFDLYTNYLNDLDNSYILNKDYIKTKIIDNAKQIVSALGMSFEICDATLMYAFVFENILHCAVYGDGNVVISKKDGNYTWDNYSYESNAPLYLSYDMDLYRKKLYLEHLDFGGKKITKESNTYVSNLYQQKEVSTKIVSSLDSMYSYTIPIFDIKSITLSTDGIETYSHNTKRLIENPSQEELSKYSTESMIQKMVSYKNNNGEFVKRRMKAMKLDCEKSQVGHFDDVSCATIWINHE